MLLDVSCSQYCCVLSMHCMTNTVSLWPLGGAADFRALQLGLAVVVVSAIFRLLGMGSLSFQCIV